jgi:hypothetical protein
VLDNYVTHKTPEVKSWLAKHARFKLHFKPTSASWLNLVERFFAEITTKRIRGGTFMSVTDLKEAIHDYLAHHNANPKALRLDQDRRLRRALDALETINARNQASAHLVDQGPLRLIDRETRQF